MKKLDDLLGHSVTTTKSTATIVKSNPKTGYWVFRVISPGGNPKGYTVRLKAVPTPEQVSQLKVDNKEVPLNKTGVKLMCTCPSWRYHGPDFYAQKMGYLLGTPQSNGDAPSKDPNENNLICKHIVPVAKLAKTFSIQP